MKILLTFIAALIFGTSSFAQTTKAGYIGKWSNGRGEPLTITAATIRYGTDKPLKYKDVTKVSDGAYFNLQIVEKGEINYLTKFISFSIGEGEKADEMKMTLYDTFKDMFDGVNSQGENTWFREKSSVKTNSGVKIYLVAVGDNGKTGKKIGCDDSLVAVERAVKKSNAPLKSAIEELLAMPREYNQQLGNYWGGSTLKLKSAAISKGIAVIRLTGEGPLVAGVCDEPRITSQIEETAKQFASVKRVKVFVNNQTLEQAIK